MPNRKLTYSTAQKIRTYPKIYSASKIIKLLNLNINNDVVESIRSGKTYNTLTQNHGSVLNSILKKEIRKEFKEGKSREELCVKYKVKYSTIRRVLTNNRSSK